MRILTADCAENAYVAQQTMAARQFCPFAVTGGGAGRGSV